MPQGHSVQVKIRNRSLSFIVLLIILLLKTAASKKLATALDITLKNLNYLQAPGKRHRHLGTNDLTLRHRLESQHY